MDSSCFNLVDSVIDEVALEGLDGITLEGTYLLIVEKLKKMYFNRHYSICFCKH